VKAVPVARKLSTIEEQRQDQVVSARILQEQRQQPRKTVLGSSPGEDVGFRAIYPIIFNDTYQMIGPVDSFRAVKIDKKCKHLSNFPAVTLRELC
jgi:hypothetical protein